MTQLERLKQKNKSLSNVIVELDKCIRERNEFIQFLKNELKENKEKKDKIWRENVEQYEEITLLRERIGWFLRNYPRLAMYEGLRLSDRSYHQLKEGGDA